MRRGAVAVSGRAGRGAAEPRLGGPTFSLGQRLARLLWHAAWLSLAAWTPHQMQPWRRMLLVLFGARIDRSAMIRGSVRIWWPANLSVGAHASMGPGVICYNVAPVSLDDFAIVSQRAHLCTGTHAIDDPAFPLVARPIAIGRNAWVAAEAFVGPGVAIGEGAVLGARAVAFEDLEAGGVYTGNPAVLRRRRRIRP
jgi:putative colanic acid biosynthesis acetyltransferase WcaF